MSGDNVFEAMKKAAYAGIGLLFVTKEKLEELAKKIAEEAKVSEGEGKKFFEELVQKTEEARQNVERMVNGAVDKALESIDLSRRSEFKALEMRVAALEEKSAREKSAS